MALINQKIKKLLQSSMKRASLITKKRCLAGRFDISNAYILTSSPRSGSTLLANTLRAIPRSCVLFEPLHLAHVPEAKAAGFTWRTYASPGQEWADGEAFFHQLFSGRIVNAWTTRETSLREACRCRNLIIKFVRANRLLPWMCQAFNINAPILLMRHPCAVIASQLNAGWAENFNCIDAPPYIDHLPHLRKLLSRIEGIEERLAAQWALDQLPALLDEGPHPWKLMTYEELVLRPEHALKSVLSEWNFEVDVRDIMRRVRQPSSVVSTSGISGIAGWKKQLTKRQVSRILSTVNEFGLEFYDRSDEADYGILNGDQIAKQIRTAGRG